MKDALVKIVPNAIYMLTKVKTHNPDSRYFQNGDTHNGQVEVVMWGPEDGDITLHLKIGNVITSPLVQVVEMDGMFAIQTKNSGYTLVRLDM
jgi:hypothetical protein